jgi:hypothetical protein
MNQYNLFKWSDIEETPNTNQSTPSVTPTATPLAQPVTPTQSSRPTPRFMDITKPSMKLGKGLWDLMAGNLHKMAVNAGEQYYKYTPEYKMIQDQIKSGKMEPEVMDEIAPTLGKSKTQIAGDTLGGVLDAATMGIGGTAIKLGKKGLMELFGKTAGVATKASRIGGTLGAGYGLAGGLQEEDGTAGSIATSTIAGGLIGKLAGYGLGFLSGKLAKFAEKKSSGLIAEMEKFVDNVKVSDDVQKEIDKASSKMTKVDIPAHVSRDEEISLLKKITAKLKEIKPLTKEQQQMYSEELTERVGQADTILRKTDMSSEDILKEMGSALGGRMERVKYAPLELTDAEITLMKDMLVKSPLSPLDIKTVESGLTKLTDGNAMTLPSTSEIKKMADVYGRTFGENLLDLTSNQSKTIQIMNQLKNSMMQAQSSTDLSFGGRQGWTALFNHPTSWWKGFKAQFPALADEELYKLTNSKIANDPDYAFAVRNGMGEILTDTQSLGGRMEETFRPSILEKIPGVNKVVDMSNRAFSAHRNVMAWDIYKKMIAAAEVQGKNVTSDPKFTRDIVRLIGRETGRSIDPATDSTKVKAFLTIADDLMYSRKLTQARLDVLTTPITYMKADPFIRKQAWRQYLAQIGGSSAILGAAQLAGLNPEMNPLSSNFGTVQGPNNTRIDVTGGYASYLRYIAQFATEKKQTSNESIVDLGEGYGSRGRAGIAESFGRTKLNPFYGYILDEFVYGEDLVGEDPDILKNYIPLAMQDLIEIQEDSGFNTALGFSLLILGGVGSSTYDRDRTVKPEGEPIELNPYQGFQP